MTSIGFQLPTAPIPKVSNTPVPLVQKGTASSGQASWWAVVWINNLPNVGNNVSAIWIKASGIGNVWKGINQTQNNINPDTLPGNLMTPVPKNMTPIPATNGTQSATPVVWPVTPPLGTAHNNVWPTNNTKSTVQPQPTANTATTPATTEGNAPDIENQWYKQWLGDIIKNSITSAATKWTPIDQNLYDNTISDYLTQHWGISTPQNIQKIKDSLQLDLGKINQQYTSIQKLETMSPKDIATMVWSKTVTANDLAMLKTANPDLYTQVTQQVAAMNKITSYNNRLNTAWGNTSAIKDTSTTSTTPTIPTLEWDNGSFVDTWNKLINTKDNTDLQTQSTTLSQKIAGIQEQQFNLQNDLEKKYPWASKAEIAGMTYDINEWLNSDLRSATLEKQAIDTQYANNIANAQQTFNAYTQDVSRKDALVKAQVDNERKPDTNNPWMYYRTWANGQLEFTTQPWADTGTTTTYNWPSYTPVDQNTVQSTTQALQAGDWSKIANIQQKQQCWAWVNDVLNQMGIKGNVFTDPISAKNAATNSTVAKVWSVAVMDTGTANGHVGFITKVDQNGNPIEMADWNRNSDGKYSVHPINATQASKITWYFDPTVDTTNNNNVDYNQYGLLSKTDFNPKNTTDILADKYLDIYLKNGTMPTATLLLWSSRAKNLWEFQKAATRAEELYFKATGEWLPEISTQKAYKDMEKNNINLLNSLKIQEWTVKSNFDLMVNNIDKNWVNQSTPVINKRWNNINSMFFGDPATAQYLVQNTTISNEISNLLAVKNAGWTTVADKMEAAGLLKPWYSSKQLKTAVSTLMQEANNAQNAVQSQQWELYKYTDPLETTSNNPNRNKSNTTIPSAIWTSRR